ncbi:tyrosine-type recombinase/integrase [Protaetiibacter larvae]|uniref:Tyrosine-type recombinase/integrase n=1 Tax=Protaetiibacter larvae TaxID=2592654 RepID=A0A5C1Y640_9MICO|nr:tyrosine-type recombinase/integrase [Protaetiibacter larvae]QEO08878.1 tyrosine-type recombinase/integrase [Protaetiibacter larvae]
MHPIPATWSSAIADYLAAQRASSAATSTMYTRRQHLEHLARRIEVGPWCLTSEQLVDYIKAQEWARETQRGRRTTIDSFYRWAKRAGHVKRSPAKVLEKVKPGDPNPNPVPDDVYLAALARADVDEALWIDLAAEHGLRRAEIARLHSRDIVPTLLGFDLIVHGKGGKLRRVPLTSAMHRALVDRGGGYLFPGAEGGHVSARWLGKRVNRLLEQPWTIHKLRHRAATRFYLAADGDSYAVAELMGWANISMVRVYVRLPDTRLRGIVEAASRHGSALRSPAWTP